MKKHSKIKRIILIAMAACLLVSVGCTQKQLPDPLKDLDPANPVWKNITTASDITMEDGNMFYMGIKGNEDWILTRVEAFKALGGIPTFEQAPWEQRLQTLANKVTSKNSPDFYKADPAAGEWPALITKNLVSPIDGLIDYDSPLFAEFKPYAEQLKVGGRMYALTYGAGISLSYVFYNRKVFEDNGLETPYDFYMRDEWTVGKMHELAKALTVIEDGENVSFGIYTHEEDAFIAATGHDLIIRDPETGKLVNNIRDPDVARALDRVQVMCREDKCMTMDQTQAWPMMMDNKLGMWAGGGWEADNFSNLCDEGLIEYVPFPRDENADKWYVHGVVFADYIPLGAKNPEAALVWAAMNIEMGRDESETQKEKDRFFEQKNMSREKFGPIWDRMRTREDFELNILMYKSFPDFRTKWYEVFWNDFYAEKIPWATNREKLSPTLDKVLKNINKLTND